MSPTDDNEPLSDKQKRELYEQAMNNVMKASASGSYNSQMQDFMASLDRFDRRDLPPNSEHSGLTFITRPKLNLQDGTLRRSRMLMPLSTENPNSLAFGVRSYMDTRYSLQNSI